LVRDQQAISSISFFFVFP